MGDVLEDAAYSAALILPAKLLPKFEAAAKLDATIDGKQPINYLYEELKKIRRHFRFCRWALR